MFLFWKMPLYLVLDLEDVYVPCSWSGRCLCTLFLIWKMSILYLVFFYLEDVHLPCSWSGRCLYYTLFLIWKSLTKGIFMAQSVLSMSVRSSMNSCRWQNPTQLQYTTMLFVLFVERENFILKFFLTLQIPVMYWMLRYILTLQIPIKYLILRYFLTEEAEHQQMLESVSNFYYTLQNVWISGKNTVFSDDFHRCKRF